MVAGAGPRSLPGVVSLTMPGGRLQRILAELSAGGQGWSDVAARWVLARKLAADARLRAATGSRPAPTRMTKEQIAATVTTIRDLVRTLRTAATEDKAEIYAGLNLQLTYQPQERIVNTRAEVGQTCTKGSCPRGT
jgi:hypothetical protein